MSGKYYASDNPERYSIGPCETREAAIADFKSENEGQEPEFIGIGKEIFCSLNGRHIIETLGDSLYDELYEDALSDWCDIPRHDPRWDALSEKLTKALHDWLDENKEPKSWVLIEGINPQQPASGPEGEVK